MKYIIANWKMNMDLKSITEWIQGYEKSLTQNKVIIAPSFLHIPLMFEQAQALDIEIAAQDISIEEKGAHTGETGVFQIKEFCKYAIIGHSERHEPIDTAIKKRDLCLNEGITPIVCFVQPENAQKVYKEGVILAWEDPQNISQNGAYREKNPQEIQTGIEQVRAIIPEKSTLIYGGSVNRQNINTLANIPTLDGVLVGNASLDTKHFADIIRFF